jgi:hypothetical protein
MSAIVQRTLDEFVPRVVLVERVACAASPKRVFVAKPGVFHRAVIGAQTVHYHKGRAGEPIECRGALSRVGRVPSGHRQREDAETAR